MASDLRKVDAYQNTAVDYEELPELTDEDFTRGIIEVGGVPVKRGVGRPAPNGAKQQVTLRLDPMAIEDWRATGPGWQARVNALLWLSSDVRTYPGADLFDVVPGKDMRLMEAEHVEAERKRVVRADRVSRALESLARQVEEGRVSKAEAERVRDLINDLRGLRLRELDLLSDVINDATAA